MSRDCRMLPLPGHILPAWLPWHDNGLDFPTPLPPSSLEMFVLWGSWSLSSFLHSLGVIVAVLMASEIQTYFYACFFFRAIHVSNGLLAISIWISPKCLKLNMSQLNSLLALIYSLSLVLNVIEEPRCAPSCSSLKPGHHSWFCSPFQPFFCSVSIYHKSF